VRPLGEEEEEENIRDLLWLPDSIGFLALVVAGAAGEAGRLLLASAAPGNDAVVAVAGAYTRPLFSSI
jgi:hypothetical protein